MCHQILVFCSFFFILLGDAIDNLFFDLGGSKHCDFTVGFSTSYTSFDMASSNRSSWSSIFLVLLKETKHSKLSVISYLLFFFYRVFLTDPDDSQDSREKERAIFIHPYHLCSFTNIHVFISRLACEMTISYFYSHRLLLPDCYSMRFTTLLN